MFARHTWLRLAVTVLLLLLGAPRPAAARWEPQGAGFDARTPRAPARFARGDAEAERTQQGSQGDGDDGDATLGAEVPWLTPRWTRSSSTTPRSVVRSAPRRTANARGPPAATTHV